MTAPSAHLPRWGVWAVGGGWMDEEAVPSPTRLSAGLSVRSTVHGPCGGGALAGVSGVRFLPDSCSLAVGPQDCVLTCQKGSRREEDSSLRAHLFPFDFQPFQESARPPPHILLGACLFFSFYHVAVVNGEGVCHRGQMGPSRRWPGGSALREGGARPRLPGSGGEGASWQAALSLRAHLPPGSRPGAAWPGRVRRMKCGTSARGCSLRLLRAQLAGWTGGWGPGPPGGRSQGHWADGGGCGGPAAFLARF